MACSYPVSAGLVWLADNAASRGRNPDMVSTISREAELPHTVAAHVLGQEAER